MLLFPPSHSPVLNFRMRGGDAARYADRLRFPRTADLPTRYAVGERVRIYWHDQRAWLTEPIQFIEITLYPRATRYRFNFLYNRRRVTLWATEQQLMEWNAPPPPKVATPRKRKRNVDRFSCAWGTCRLDVHPDIPARWAARHIPTGAVIELPAISQSTAHERFVAFMARLDRDIPLTEADRAVKLELKPIQKAAKQKTARMKLNATHNPKPDYHGHRSERRNTRFFGTEGQLRIRRYAA